jgi:hypothetical protein
MATLMATRRSRRASTGTPLDRVNFTADPEVLARLDAYADARGISRSLAISRMLGTLLDGATPDDSGSPPPGASPRDGARLDLASDAAMGTRRDVAYNPRVGLLDCPFCDGDEVRDDGLTWKCLGCRLAGRIDGPDIVVTRRIG